MNPDKSTSETKREVRPLTASEWKALLKDTDYTLRVSDGTREGSWYFWCDGEQLFGRRFIWYDDSEVPVADLAAVLDGDTTTQLVVRSDQSNGVTSP